MTTLNVEEGYIAFPRRLSLTIALGFAIALSGQTGGFVWYAAKQDSRIENLEGADKRILDRGDERWRSVGERLSVLERDRSSADIRLTRIEEQSRWTVDALGRIERKLEGASRR